MPDSCDGLALVCRGKSTARLRFVGHVGLDQSKPGIRQRLGKIRAHAAGEVIDSGYEISVPQKAVGEMTSDESGGAGKNYVSDGYCSMK